MVKAADQFHVGIVVDDLDAALAQLGASFGYEWGIEVRAPAPVVTAAGESTVDFRFRYSRSTPSLEVIESRPGTLWVPAEGSGIHHLGYWSDDVARDAAELERAGFAREAAGALVNGTPIWTYHRAARGPRIELISRSLEAALAP